jgi:hypothetical protein
MSGPDSLGQALHSAIRKSHVTKKKQKKLLQNPKRTGFAARVASPPQGSFVALSVNLHVNKVLAVYTPT